MLSFTHSKDRSWSIDDLVEPEVQEWG